MRPRGRGGQKQSDAYNIHQAAFLRFSIDPFRIMVAQWLRDPIIITTRTSFSALLSRYHGNFNRIITAIIIRERHHVPRHHGVSQAAARAARGATRPTDCAETQSQRNNRTRRPRGRGGQKQSGEYNVQQAEFLRFSIDPFRIMVAQSDNNNNNRDQATTVAWRPERGIFQRPLRFVLAFRSIVHVALIHAHAAALSLMQRLCRYEHGLVQQ